VSIAQVLRILIARRWIIFITLITCVVVALATAKSLPERYQASARIVLDVLKPDPVTGQMMGGPAMRSYINTQTQLIQDYRVAGDVVDRAGWLQNPTVIASWQAETNGVGDMRRWAAARIIESTEARMIEGSNILEISYQSPNPAASKSIVNLLREAYIDASLRFKTDSAGRTADWYREQSNRALKALNAAEATKAKFEQENGIILGPQNADAENVKLAGLQQALLAARSNVSSQQYEAVKQSLNSPVVDSLKVQLSTLNDQIQQAGERLGSEHPSYKALITRRDSLNREIARETAAARASGAAQSGTSRRSITELEAEYAAQKALVLGMKDKMNELAQMQREIDLRRVQYETAAQKTADLRLQANLSESGLVVLGDAISSSKPVFPNWPLIIGAAVGFGLALGLVVALLAELLARRVRGPEDLAFASKSHVLAVVSEAQPSPFLESIRRRFRRGSKDSPEWQPAQ
jgi:uncharacterized protein involved in exopolysaccharide biosynthesis